MTERQGAGLENRYARKGFGVRIPVPPQRSAQAIGLGRSVFAAVDATGLRNDNQPRVSEPERSTETRPCVVKFF